MSVNWGLLGQPVNVLESLQLLGKSQDNAREQQKSLQVEQLRLANLAKEQQFQQRLGGAINPQTGQIDSAAARMAYIGAGNAEGAIKFGRDQTTDFAARRKQVAEPFAQAAMDVLNLPDDQIAGAVSGYLDEFERANPDAGQFRQVTLRPPGEIRQFLKGLLAETGYLDDFRKANEPKEFNVGPGDARYSRAADGSITTIIAPNNGEGSFGDPVGGGGGLEVGSVVSGFVFQGGNPKDRNNWVKGGRGESPGTFPGQ